MAQTKIRIPTPLRVFTAGANEVTVAAETVGAALQALDQAHAGILERVVGTDGQVRGFVNVYLGDQNIRTLGGLETSLSDRSVISIVPAVAGGRR